MATMKTTNLSIRIDTELKQEAETLFAELARVSSFNPRADKT